MKHFGHYVPRRPLLICHFQSVLLFIYLIEVNLIYSVVLFYIYSKLIQLYAYMYKIYLCIFIFFSDSFPIGHCKILIVASFAIP